MGRHYASCERDDWMSPTSLIERVSRVDTIVFDPCAPYTMSDWESLFGCNGEVWSLPNGVDHCEGNGLAIEWAKVTRAVKGLVYANPPYGGRKGVIDAWIKKCAVERERGAEIVGCIPASTGSRWFRGVWETAQAVCFPYGRLSFVKPGVRRPASQLRLFDEGEDNTAEEDNSATFWSAIPYWGNRVERFHEAFDGYGETVEPGRRSGSLANIQRSLAAIVAEIDGGVVAG